MRVRRVGLTGGIASGKSTIGRRLAERGIPVLDADRVVRDLYAPGGRGAAAIRDAFGADTLDERGAVDRRRLAELAFGDPAVLARLNAIVHPLVHEEQDRWFEGLEKNGGTVGVVEATLLLESGGRSRFDTILTVSAPEDVRLERALKRTPGVSREELLARIRGQMPDLEREKLADVVIRTDRPLDDVLAEADRLADQALAGSLPERI